MADSINIGLFYRLVRQDNQHDVIVRRDAGAPKLVSGGARWNVVNRPRRGGFTTWDGSDPYRMDVPVLFDGWDTGRSQEDAISILNQMHQPPGDFTPPPTIKIEGAVPVKNAIWVVDPEIDWGDNVIWHKDGYRLRQDAVVHLLQYVTADKIEVKAPATSHTYVVKTGDTLKSISRSQYGTPIYWSTIKNANKIRDPKKLPRTLTIPQIIGK